MNILFYAKRGFNPKSGGIERVSDMLAHAFEQRGHRIYYVTWLLEEKKYEVFQPEFEQLLLPNSHKATAQENVVAFSRFVIEKKIDVLLCQYVYEWEVARLAILVKEKTAVKLISVLHSSPNFSSLSLEELSKKNILPSEKRPHRVFKRLQRKWFKKLKQQSRDKASGILYQNLLDGSDALVVLSESYIPVVLSLIAEKSSDKIFSISNPNTYRMVPINDEEKENTILFVGRMSIEKRPEKVLLTWQRIQHLFPEWNMKMIGVGRLDDDVQKLRRTLKLQRCFIDGLQDPKPYYEKAKILLLVSDYEGFPLAITEAMVHGVVPVAFNTFRALPDMVEDGVSGLIVSAYDMEELAEKLTLLMSNDSLRRDLAAAARNSVQRYDIENIVDCWLRFFNQIGVPGQ